jgi:hypothetical protein
MVFHSYIPPAPYRPLKQDQMLWQPKHVPVQQQTNQDFSMRINPDTRVFVPKTKYVVYPKRVTGMRDITDIEFPRYYDRNNPNKQKEDQNSPTSYKHYLANDVSIIRNFIKANEGDRANNINPLSDQEIDIVYKLCQSQKGSVVVDDSYLMQLCAYSSSFKEPNTIVTNNEYETLYSGLDITFYKSVDMARDNYDAIFIDIYPNAQNLDERKELLLYYVNKLTNEDTQNSKFMIICSNDRITDFFKWIGKKNIMKFLKAKFRTNTDKENEQILQEIYKESPDVQFASMTEAIQDIAKNAQWQMEDNQERMRHYAAMNNVLSTLSENVQQGNQTLNNTLGELTADMRRGNMNISDNLTQLVENTRRRNLDAQNQEALNIINDLSNNRQLTEQQIEDALAIPQVQSDQGYARVFMPPATPKTPYNDDIPEEEDLEDFIGRTGTPKPIFQEQNQEQLVKPGDPQLGPPIPYNDKEEEAPSSTSPPPVVVEAEAAHNEFVTVECWDFDTFAKSSETLKEKKFNDVSYVILPGKSKEKLSNLYFIDTDGRLFEKTDETIKEVVDEGYRIVKTFDYVNSPGPNSMLLDDNNKKIAKSKRFFHIKYERLPPRNLGVEAGSGYRRKKGKKMGGSLSDAIFNISSFERVNINPATGKSIYVLSF